MPDYLPKFKPGEAYTLPTLAAGAIIGGQLVTAAAAVAAADSITWIGVASKDTAAGQPLGVYSDGVQRLVAAGALAVGALVKCAAAGQITTWVPGTDPYERYVGITLEAAAGASSVVAVRMSR
ncbi:capsid cement protein [Blastococcus sp. CT_GayMR16]|uniref:capsid cement protein n=1 Tax=Blastococcus sp. CT_GayMR16 TaxID=2559607 RepID=UPI0010749BAD|nr:capsid cement protein [Blastococcus sp. CT_GayMR16]TFV83152.1 DUF2190 family protein [Blastococcus sp. CT_GayMR16]